MNYFRVNGINYDVIVTEIVENFNILYSDNTGRTLADGAPITLDPLGTFIGHKVTIKRKNGNESEYDSLYNLITKPRKVLKKEDALLFEVAHLQDSIAYEGYVSTGERKLERIDEKTGKIYWGELTLNIIPIEAQVLPQ